MKVANCFFHLKNYNLSCVKLSMLNKNFLADGLVTLSGDHLFMSEVLKTLLAARRLIYQPSVSL